ncbi:Carbohydrate esterase 4 protein [Tulasnella sp. 403]|nr:Carbohydrate esterase 4 protein [Tulasnella sp. 403]
MFSQSRLVAILFSLSALVNALPAGAPEDKAEGNAEIEARWNLAKVYKHCVNNKQIALTFNDGPTKWTEDLVNVLDGFGAKGTFFVTGKQNGHCIYHDKSVARINYAYSHGHQIATHTWDHPGDLRSLSDPDVNKELHRLDRALKKILGIKAHFFRPPGGNYDNRIRKLVKANGQDIVLWDFDPNDSASGFNDIKNNNPNKALITAHETHDVTWNILPWFIPDLQSKGYSFVTVAECLGGLNPYDFVGSPSTKDASWHC